MCSVAGDLRIPHFVGMHALQLMPLAAIALEWLARRLPRLRDTHARSGVLLIVALTDAALLAVLTWQALRGQSIVQPDAATVTVTVAIAIAATACLVVVARVPVPAGTEPVSVR